MTLQVICLRLSSHSRAIARAIHAEGGENAHSSGLPVPFHDVEDRVLADSDVSGDPAVASPFADGLRHLRCEPVRLRPLPGLTAQHFRIAGLNLLTAAVIHWNTDRLGRAVRKRMSAGLETPEGLPEHISPLGWGHILITGEYRWPGTTA